MAAGSLVTLLSMPQVQVYYLERLLACRPDFATPPKRHFYKTERCIADASNAARFPPPHCSMSVTLRPKAGYWQEAIDACDFNSLEGASSRNPFLQFRPHFLKRLQYQIDLGVVLQAAPIRIETAPLGGSRFAGLNWAC